jgi:hypothetical protein
MCALAIAFVTAGVDVAPRRQPSVLVPRVGRNQPCRCGSGRKLKQCCGAGSTGGQAPGSNGSTRITASVSSGP